MIMVSDMSKSLINRFYLVLTIPLLFLISACTPNATIDDNQTDVVNEQIYQTADWEGTFHTFEDHIVESGLSGDVKRITQVISTNPYQIDLSLQLKERLSSKQIEKLAFQATNMYSEIVLENLSINDNNQLRQSNQPNRFGELFNHFDLGLHVYTEENGKEQIIINQKIFKQDNPQLIIRN